MAPPRRRQAAPPPPPPPAPTRVTRRKSSTVATAAAETVPPRPPPARPAKRAAPPVASSPRATKKGKRKSTKSTPAATSMPESESAQVTAVGAFATSLHSQQPALAQSASDFVAAIAAPRRDAFDLQDYLASTSDQQTAVPAAQSVLSDIAGLREELRTALLSFHAAQTIHAAPAPLSVAPVPPALAHVHPLSSFTSQPNRSGVLPPTELRTLTSAAFSKQPRQIHPPHPVDQLAASRQFPVLHSPQGKLYTPTSFLHSIQTDPTVEFDKPKSVLSCLFSASVGDPGASVMYFEPSARKPDQLHTRKSGVCDDDFAAKSLPVITKIENAETDPLSYDDILSTVHGLSTFTSRYCYEFVQRLIDRARVFVATNKAHDRIVRSSRVILTLNAVNMFLVRAFQCLRDDSPLWWSNFSDAVENLNYNSMEWLLLLTAHAPTPAPPAPPATTPPHSLPQRPQPPPSRPQHSFNKPTQGGQRTQDSYVRLPGFPEHIKKLVPKNKDGFEPCLKFFSGHGCSVSGKSCTRGPHLHEWDEALDPKLLQFIKKYFDPNSRQSN